MTTRRRVLCIDDDDMVTRLVAEVVEFCGHEPIRESDPMRATTEHIRDTSISVVLTDYMMPKLDGVDVLTIWQESRPDVRRVLITAAPHEQNVKEAARNGTAQMVISKPPSIADIKMALAWL